MCTHRISGGVAVCFAVLLACAAIPRPGHAQGATPGVFSTLQTELVPDISVALEPATMRSRVVQVDTGQVIAARLGRETLRLNLFDDAAIAVQIDRVRPTRSGYFITGRPEGMEWGEVRLVVNGPVMVGTVVTPDGKYTIRFAGSGRHVVRQVDPSAEAVEDDVVESPLPPAPPQAIAPGDPLGAVVRPATDTVQDQPTEDGSEVRVLVVYTPSMRTRQGGTAGMDAVIDLMIQSANEAFETSGINPRLVLAHTALVNYVEEISTIDVTRLASPDDGYMDEVHALRNEYAADLVHLITLRMAGPGGTSSVIRSESLSFESTAAFAVSASDSEETFAHETGHNFGLRHDRYSDRLFPPIYPYAYGYQNNRAFEPGAPASARWSTIMAYPDRCADAGFYCPRLMRFSNPDQTYLGDPLGVPADDPATGPEGPADARLTVNRTARWVGSFRSDACTKFAVSPETPVAPVDGGGVILEVETAPGCLWEASSQSAFLAPVSDARHAGPGLVNFDVEPNQSGAERIGTVTVAGKSVEVRQLATGAGICSRTSAVARAIAGDASCDKVTEERLSQIVRLDLGNQGLASLKPGDFDGLSNLVLLSLDDNRFTELPENLFTGLSNLERLSVGHNRLTELPAGSFAGMSKLRDLWLHSNGLKSLPEGVFSGLAGLQSLSLSNNELSEIPEGTFAGLSQLRTLNLEHNKLSELSSSTFAGLSNLSYLTLGGNSYDMLPIGLFSDLDFLRHMSLGSNRLSSLPDDVFAGLSYLEHLSVQGSPLSELPPGIFRDLRRVKALIFHHTVMPSLPEGIFSDLTALEELRLKWGQLNTLPSGIFAELGALRRLDLAENQLSSLPNGVFVGLKSLESLSLQGNPVDPLQLELTLEKVGDNQFKAVLPAGAPFELAIPITSHGGMVDGNADTVTIPAGAVESSPTGISRNADTQQRVTVDVGALPDLPNGHSGYMLAKDEGLPISVLGSLDPADAALSGLWLSQERLNPVFSPDTTRYTVSLAHSASSATVTLATSNASATVAFDDENDDALPDADANADGHQVNLHQAENVIKLEVTAENGTSTRTYIIVITREDNHCDRTEEVLTAILASVPDVDACGDLRHAHLAKISRLDLRERGISSLKSDDFAGLSALETLLLQFNQLTDLPADAFSGLSALEILRLEHNQLTELPTGVFSGLSSLVFLNLPGNQLESLPENVFSGLSALRRLYLIENQLSRLPDGIFSGLSRLESLGLSSNKIASLPTNVFSDLSSLRDLSLNSNVLTSLPADAFFALSGLNTLDLGRNGLTYLPPNVFSGLIVLRRLSLHSNALTSLPADAFSDSSELESLSLADNALTSLPSEVFSGLTVLQRLWLSGNQLTALPDGLFAGLSKLRRLGLRRNAVDPLPISVSLQSEAGGRVKAVVPAGAPFALELPLSVGGGGRIEGDANTVTVPTGAVESAPLRVTRIDEDADTATVDIASLPTLPREPEIHDGYVLTKDATLPIEITLPEEILPPAQVAGIEVTPGVEQMVVSWTAVEGADGYTVQWRSGEDEYAESRQAVVSGGDTVSYTITGLSAGTDYKVRVIATREGVDDGLPSAEDIGTTRSGDPDVNGDGALDGDDAQIMYFAYRFPSLVGDGETGGTEASRKRFLGGYSGLDDPSDEDLQGMVAKANTWRTEGLTEGGDINADGAIDWSDARAMYHAYTYESLLGDGEEGGAARFRAQLLGPLAGKSDPTDEELKAMLRRANELREAFSG